MSGALQQHSPVQPPVQPKKVEPSTLPFKPRRMSCARRAIAAGRIQFSRSKVPFAIMKRPYSNRGAHAVSWHVDSIPPNLCRKRDPTNTCTKSSVDCWCTPQRPTLSLNSFPRGRARSPFFAVFTPSGGCRMMICEGGLIRATCACLLRGPS